MTPQVVAASMVLSAALSLQLQYHPFVDADHNFLESIGLHACLVQLLVALLSNTVGKIDGDTLGEVSTAMLVLTMFGSSLFFFGWTTRLTIQSSQETEGVVGMVAKACSSRCGTKGNAKTAKARISQSVVVPHLKRVKLSRQLTINQVKRAVVHGQVDRIQQKGEDLRKKFVNDIEKREKIADARVRQRLIERRKLKSGRDLRAWNLSKLQKQEQNRPSEKLLVKVEKLRCKLKKKIKTLQRLHVVFAKLDVDANGMFDKREFESLVSAILKKKSLDKKILGLLWEAAWKQRKHGDEDELDAATLSHWLGLNGLTHQVV